MVRSSGEKEAIPEIHEFHTPEKTASESHFFWDTSFSVVGAREFDPTLAQERRSHREFLPRTIRARAAGFPVPSRIHTGPAKGRPRSHVLGPRGGCINPRTTKNGLRAFIPGLAGSVNFWTKYHSSPRGLAEYFNAGQIGDDDARFDRVYNRKNEREHNNEPVSGFESPDLNAFLVLEMRSLSMMAQALNQPKEAEEWADRATDLAKRIVDCFYFPDEAMFYDVVEGTHEKFSGVKNPNMFLPLWAGVPLPETEVRRVIKLHMLNPNAVFPGNCRFPVSRSTTRNTIPEDTGTAASGLISSTGCHRRCGGRAITKKQNSRPIVFWKSCRNNRGSWNILTPTRRRSGGTAMGSASRNIYMDRSGYD